jgi:hypothetical protein
MHQLDDVRLGDPAGGIWRHAASSSIGLSDGESDGPLTISECARQRHTG